MPSWVPRAARSKMGFFKTPSFKDRKEVRANTRSEVAPSASVYIGQSYKETPAVDYEFVLLL